MPSSYLIGSALNTPVFEGAFACGIYPAASAPCGEGGYAAGEDGVILGRFGWGDPATGKVFNERTDPTQQLGVTLPQFLNPRNRVYGALSAQGPVMKLRQGKNMVLAANGAFWLRFAGGAYPGQRVYANLLDGSAIAGQTVGAELTPYFVATMAAPGALAVISSSSKYGV